MRREDRDDLIRSFLAINAMLRAEAKALRRAIEARREEAKHNPNWQLQPRAPKGTADGGQWTNGRSTGLGRSGGPKGRGRSPQNHNRAGPDSLVQIFPGVPNSPADAILAPVDSLLGISEPGYAANEAAVRNIRDALIADLRELRPSYRFQSIDPGGMPTTIAGRNTMLDSLRAERAAAILSVRGNIEPLQVETLRFMQRRTDIAYDRAVRLYEAGQLNTRLSRNEAIGNYVDANVRRSLREFYARFGVSIARGEGVQVNRRAYNVSELSYRVPDARVGAVIFDATLTRKMPGSAQVRGFFESGFHPTAVVIVRPSQLGRGSTYLITPPQQISGD